jgi:4-aminobutyrate---pyruvate transaminase
MSKLSFSHIFAGKSHDDAIELSEKLKELAPCPASKVLFCSGGSEANDMQVKLTWYYNNARGKPEKKKIISRIKAYHGVTVAAGSLTGLPAVQTDFDLPIKNVVFTSCPHFYRFGADGESEDEFTDRMARELDELIQKEGPETVAAFIAEPVMGAGGVIIPPANYFPKIQQVLAKYDVRIISDEVICGFGRSGTGSGRSPRLPADLDLDGQGDDRGLFPHGRHHHRGRPLPGDAEPVGKDRRVRPRLHLHRPPGRLRGGAQGHRDLRARQHQRPRARGREGVRGALRQARRPPAGGRGALHGADRRGRTGGRQEDQAQFDPKKLVGPTAANVMQKNGLITRAVGDAVALCPPLIITEEQIHEIFDLYEKGLDETEAWVRSDDLRAA